MQRSYHRLYIVKASKLGFVSCRACDWSGDPSDLWGYEHVEAKLTSPLANIGLCPGCGAYMKVEKA